MFPGVACRGETRRPVPPALARFFLSDVTTGDLHCIHGIDWLPPDHPLPIARPARSKRARSPTSNLKPGIRNLKSQVPVVTLSKTTFGQEAGILAFSVPVPPLER